MVIPLLIQYYSYDTHYKIFEHEVYFNNKKNNRSVRMSFVLGNKHEVVPDLAEEHLRDLDPVRAAGGGEEGLQLGAAPEDGHPLVDPLGREHQDTVWHVPVREAQPL